MTSDQMEKLTAGFATKADKMRALERQGVSRADIARFLGVRYQQVRNTLEGDKRTGYSPLLAEPLDATDNIRFDSKEEPVFAELNVRDDGSVHLLNELIDRIPGDANEAIYAIVVHDGLFVTSLSGALGRLSRSL